VRSYLKDGYAKKNRSREVSSDGTELLIVARQLTEEECR
jgi:hypothetical protein